MEVENDKIHHCQVSAFLNTDVVCIAGFGSSRFESMVFLGGKNRPLGFKAGSKVFQNP